MNIQTKFITAVVVLGIIYLVIVELIKWMRNRKCWRVVYSNTKGAWADGWYTKEEAIKEMFDSEYAYAITKKKGLRKRAIDRENCRVRKVKDHFIYEEK